MRDLALENRHLQIVLSGEAKGGLRSLVDKASGRDFIAAEPRPLYRLVLAERGKEAVEVSSLDAENVDVERAASPQGETLTLRYGRHQGLDLRVTCRVTLDADSALSRWRISIENGTAHGVRAIQYPVVISPPVLGESDEDDVYLRGPWGGQIMHRPNRRNLLERKPTLDWCPNRQYPGLVSVQMQAYYDEAAGLYMATYDDAGCVKQFCMFREGGDLDLSIEHNYDEAPGLDFELPYDTVLGVFRGDWYAAADLYKEWAHEQHWCARKLGERDDLPGWMKEPRPCMMVISQGDVARSRGILSYPPSEYPIGQVYPARRAVARVRRCAEIFETPVMVWMEGWEKIGAPGGPAEIFPPREGEASYKAAMAEFARDGTPVLMYLAGFHWCYKRPMTGYSDWERFEREGRPLAAVNERGEFNVSTPAQRPYLAGQKHFVPLCVGCRETQDLYLANFMKMMDLGAVAVQHDQQLGFYADVCYSEEHDHAPGYGPWMTQKMREFVRRVRGAAKERTPQATLSVECPCEVWIQEVDFPLDRPYMMGTIPLFEYLYHEYAMAWGGDVKIGFAHPEVSLIKHATILVRGTQNVVTIGEPEYDYDVDPDYPVFALLRNIFAAQRTFARDYVLFGRMLRPAPLETGRVSVDVYQSVDTVDVPKVLHSTWRSQAGKTGTVMVNWTGEPEEVSLALQGEARGASIVTAAGSTPAREEDVRSGRISTVVPPRGVLLVEQEGE